MNPDVAPRAFVAGPGEGERLGMARQLRVSTAQTGVAFEVMELDSAKGPLPHTHHDREECFYIIEGRFTFVLSPLEMEAPAGSVVFVPLGTRPAFRPGPRGASHCVLDSRRAIGGLFPAAP